MTPEAKYVEYAYQYIKSNPGVLVEIKDIRDYIERVHKFEPEDKMPVKGGTCAHYEQIIRNMTSNDSLRHRYPSVVRLDSSKDRRKYYMLDSDPKKQQFITAMGLVDPRPVNELGNLFG